MLRFRRQTGRGRVSGMDLSGMNTRGMGNFGASLFPSVPNPFVIHSSNCSRSIVSEPGAVSKRIPPSSFRALCGYDDLRSN